MGFIKLNRYGDPGGCVFDAAAVVAKARETFANVQGVPGDKLALGAERAAALGAADGVVRTLRRNQQEYGPAYAFAIASMVPKRFTDAHDAMMSLAYLLTRFHRTGAGACSHFCTTWDLQESKRPRVSWRQ